MNENAKRIYDNKAIKLISNLIGVVFPLTSCIVFAFFAFGQFTVTADADCWAVEYPHKVQYNQNPHTTDTENNVGLDSINVTNRFSWIAWCGFWLFFF